MPVAKTLIEAIKNDRNFRPVENFKIAHFLKCEFESFLVWFKGCSNVL